jgi:hypothetical protein
MKDWSIIVLGVVTAVIAALFVEWINRALSAPTATPGEAAWIQVVCGCTLPNNNLRPTSPASAYQGGAPVTNFRPYQRIGVLEVPVCE